jgi:hypothetical protein
MPPCVFDVCLGHIDPEDRKLRPDLFECIDKASCAATDFDNFQLALVPFGKDFVELWQCLSPYRVRRTVKENFDLSVVQFGRFLRQPTPRLVVEVLQVITGVASRG